jgi:hypothetical protein
MCDWSPRCDHAGITPTSRRSKPRPIPSFATDGRFPSPPAPVPDFDALDEPPLSIGDMRGARGIAGLARPWSAEDGDAGANGLTASHQMVTPCGACRPSSTVRLYDLQQLPRLRCRRSRGRLPCQAAPRCRARMTPRCGAGPRSLSAPLRHRLLMHMPMDRGSPSRAPSPVRRSSKHKRSRCPPDIVGRHAVGRQNAR